MSEEALLFEGLKVLDVGSWIAGPVAGTMLADRGADVLKVEMPEIGDGYRYYADLPFTPTADTNYTWSLDGRNKRSLALNLKSEDGMAILKRLIAECDVYITNQPLPLRRELALTFDDLASLNERMIYASLTPYGETGPDADNEAFDLVAYWNRSGLMDKMRHAGNEPMQALAGMGDHPTAVSMYASIVTALLQRERTGKGTFVHTSLLANGLWSASCLAQAQLANADFSTVPPQRLTGALYATNDNRWIQLTMVRTDEQFDTMLAAMEAFDLLADERFSTMEGRLAHADELTVALRAMFVTRSSEEWIQLLRVEHQLPIEKVAEFTDLENDPHLTANQMMSPPVDDIGISHIINDPVNVKGVRKIGARRSPSVGEHSAEVLKELGLGAEEIERLRGAGVIS